METEPQSKELTTEQKVLLELLMEIGDDWTGKGCRAWIERKIIALEQDE